MKRIAIARRGDRTELVPYATEGEGHHVFDYGGELHFVRISEDIQAVTLDGLGDLVETHHLSWWSRWRLRKVLRQAHSESVHLRYFRQVGEGWIEFPVANLVDGLARFWGDLVHRCVELDADGVPRANLRKVIDSEGKEVTSVASVAKDLQALGLTGVQIHQLIDTAIETQRGGWSETFVRGQVIDQVVSQDEDTGVWPFIAAYVAYLGFEVGATTELGTLYAGTETRGWVIIAIAALLGIGFLLKRWFTRK